MASGRSKKFIADHVNKFTYKANITANHGNLRITGANFEKPSSITDDLYSCVVRKFSCAGQSVLTIGYLIASDASSYKMSIENNSTSAHDRTYTLGISLISNDYVTNL